MANRWRWPNARAMEKLAPAMPTQLSSTAQDLARAARRARSITSTASSRGAGAELGVATPVNRTLHALVKPAEAVRTPSSVSFARARWGWGRGGFEPELAVMPVQAVCAGRPQEVPCPAKSSKAATPVARDLSVIGIRRPPWLDDILVPWRICAQRIPVVADGLDFNETTASA